MSRLERLNDWCGRVLDKAIRYDDLITFVTFSFLFVMIIIALVVGTLGMLGYIK